MSFFWPNVLWLLAIPVVLLGLEFRRRRDASTSVNHPKIVRAEAGTQSLHLTGSLIPVSDRRSRWRILLGLTFAILALARPQWGHLDEPVFDQAREIIIALDLSRSMLSPDVKPTRLDRAKLLVQSLLERLSGERVGLFVFSGTAFLQSPLSSDYEILNEFLPQMSPDYLPEGGTNYSDLINTAISAFGNGSGADRYMIILSDGEATDDDWKSAAEKLKGKGIRVIGLGVGTTQGAMIPDGSGGFVKDERGAVVLSKIEPATLKALASMTNGTYADASSWVDLAQLLKATVDKGAKGHFREERNVRLVERYQWPLGAALIFFLWSFWQEFAVYPRSRDIKLRGAANRTTPPLLPPSPSAASATVAHLLALGCLLFAAHPRLQALTETAPPATAPTPVPPPGVTPGLPSTAESTGPSHGDALAAPLTQMVTQFSARDHLSAKDYAELAQTTVTYGERLREAHKPILEGPLHDGLNAVERGEALDPHAADWDKLKASLEELLQPPPPTPTPPPQKQKNQDKKNDQDKNDQSKNDQDKSSDQDQKSKDDQSKNDQSKSADQKQNDQSKQNASKNQNQDSAKNAQNNSSKADSAGQPTPTPANQNDSHENASHPQDASSGFGNMEKKPAGQPTPAPVPASPETQKVGGVNQANPVDKNDNPALAIPLEKLQQVKDGDSPVRLQQLMRGNQKTPAKQGKNW